MWPHQADDHVTTIVMISATTYTPDRTGTPVAVVTIRGIVYMIKGMVNIGVITIVIVTGTPLLGLDVTTLLLSVGLGLMDQTDHHNQHVLAETNPTRISKILSAGRITMLQDHAEGGMRRKSMM